MKYLFLHSAFSNYYLGNPSNIFGNNLRIPYNHDDFWYFDNFFQDFKQRVISITTDSSIKLVFEYSIFINCSNNKNNNGGAFFFDCNNGAISINRLCAYYCYTQTSNSGQFAYILPSNDHISCFDYISMSYCSPELVLTSTSSIYVERGEIKIKGLNSSYNSLYDYSGFSVNKINNFLMTYSTTVFNSATNNWGVYLNEIFGTMKYLNFANNTMPSNKYLIFHYQSQTLMEFSIFRHNSGYGIHSASSTYPITIKNCFFLYSSTPYSGPGLNVISTLTTTQTLLLNHFASHYCKAENLLSETNTPAITPTPSFNENNCQTIPPPPTPYQTYPSTCDSSNSINLNKIIEISTLMTLIQLFIK